MASRLLAAMVAIAASATSAGANGRPSATSTINFQRGDDSHIIAGMTFGALVSDDAGATWHWMCEDAIKYTGIYDPFYAYMATGTIFATTFDGSLVNRDGCTYGATTFGPSFVSTLSQGPNGALYMALAQPAAGADAGDSKIYRSDDDGMTFSVSAEPGLVNDWWESIKVAPSDPQRVYLTGYRLGGGMRTQLLFESVDGGTTYQPMGQTGLRFTNNSTANVVGVSPTDPDVIYLLVDQLAENIDEQAIFRSTDGGDTWTEILSKQVPISFLARANGDLVAATQTMGTQLMRAPATGMAWETVPGAPHINCLSENAAQELWACTTNYDLLNMPGSSDGAGIMKTTDLTSWTPVLKFQDIEAPLACEETTIQYGECQIRQWCVLRSQLGITANPTCCRTDPESGFGFIQGCDTESPPDNGCCDSSASGAQTGVLVGLLGTVIILRRRKRGS